MGLVSSWAGRMRGLGPLQEKAYSHETACAGDDACGMEAFADPSDVGGEDVCAYVEAFADPSDVGVKDACVCTWKPFWILPVCGG